MSFLDSPVLAVGDGDALDARAIMSALTTLSALQRTWWADHVGPAWMGGLGVQAPQEALLSPLAQAQGVPPIQASVDAGMAVPVEARAVVPPGVDLAVRSRQPTQRPVALKYNSHHVVAASADATDETLALVGAYADPATLPDGAVPLSWVGTDYERVTTTLSMAMAPGLGLTSKAASTTVLSTTAWQPLTDARVAVLLRPGDRVWVTFFANVANRATNAFLQPFPEVQFLLHNSTPENDYEPAPAFTGTNVKMTHGATSTTKNPVWWQGVYAPQSTSPSVHLLAMHARAWQADVSDAFLTVRILRADRAAS